MSAFPAVTDASLAEAVAPDDGFTILVDFWATWCKPCLALEPAVVEVAERHVGRLRVVALNVDENPDAAATHGVLSLPTLILFRDGVEVERIVGNVRPKKLGKIIARHVVPSASL